MKRIKKFLPIILVIMLGILFIISFPVKADSGFDSDFDFGGSDFDFGSSDYGDYGGFDFSSDGGVYYVGSFFTIFNVIMAIIIIIVIVSKLSKAKQTSLPQKGLSEEEIYNILGNNFNYEEFKHTVFLNYQKIQVAWMNNEIESVRSLLSDFLFNTYKTQLLTLSSKKQKNMMEDINYVDAYITNIKKVIEGEEIEVALIVTCKDYIIDIDSKEVLRGNKNRINKYYYKLTFEKTANLEVEKFCPNCGALLPKGSSVKCEYCRSVVIKKTSNYILTDKKMLKQE